MSLAGFLGQGRFRFLVDPFGHDKRSWSSEFIQALIGVFFSEAVICRLWPSASLGLHRRLPDHCFYKLLIFKKFAHWVRGPEAASSYAHGASSVDAGGTRLWHPKILNVILTFYMSVFVKTSDTWYMALGLLQNKIWTAPLQVDRNKTGEWKTKMWRL